MSLKAVKGASKFDDLKRQGTVVIESDNDENEKAINELSGVDVKHFALKFALSCGMADPRINGNVSHCYPVNADGDSLVEAQNSVDPKTQKKYPPEHKKMKLHRYRVDVPVVTRLV